MNWENTFFLSSQHVLQEKVIAQEEEEEQVEDPAWKCDKINSTYGVNALVVVQ